MKLLHLSPALCAFLVACGDTDAGEASSTTPKADKPVSYTEGKDTSTDRPETHIVERTGIDPKTKTVKVGGSEGKPDEGKPE